MNCLLIGFKKSGKTTIGALLAEKCMLPHIDTDAMLTKKLKASPFEFVTKFSEEKFRKEENDLLKELAALSDTVISLGGGSIECENFFSLKREGILFYLKTDFDLLKKRISANLQQTIYHNNEALLLNNFCKRKKIYEDQADFIIEMKNKSQDQAADEIRKKYYGQE